MEEFRIIVRYTNNTKLGVYKPPIVKVFKSWSLEDAKARTNHLKSMLKENGYRILDIECLKVEKVEL